MLMKIENVSFGNNNFGPKGIIVFSHKFNENNGWLFMVWTITASLYGTNGLKE